MEEGRGKRRGGKKWDSATSCQEGRGRREEEREGIGKREIKPNQVVDYLAEWYNNTCDRPKLEASLGHKLPENFSESIPKFAEILGGYLAQANSEEPDYGVLVLKTGQLLAFMRSYAVDKISEAVVNDLIGVVNEMSQVCREEGGGRRRKKKEGEGRGGRTRGKGKEEGEGRGRKWTTFGVYSELCGG
jgi:hypothetical protein